MNSKEIVAKTKEAMKESNRILIEELIRDFKEKGIKPVIAVDGEIKYLSVIDEAEIEDFCQILEENKKNINDFCVFEEESDKNYIEGNVIVLNKITGKMKKYRTGNNSNWVTDFAADLKNNFFNS